jgi:phosphoadenylyl-sulfate reductase (thioredoxin)
LSSTPFVSEDSLDDESRRLEGRPAEETLDLASRRYGPRIAFATGFGPEGCVLIDLIGRHRLPIPIFTLDTGLLFPETYELWRRLEARYGLAVRAVRPRLSVLGQARVHGPSLWERDPDRCCALRKMEPLREALSGLDAWVTAIRRDQTAERAGAGVLEADRRFGLVKVNPIVTWTHDDVWRYIRANDVPFNPLHERGYPSIGCGPCTTPVRPGEPARAGRWRHRDKTECGLHVGAAATRPPSPVAEEAS